jgi:selenocysteine lyase/cysteine desulfurase
VRLSRRGLLAGAAGLKVAAQPSDAAADPAFAFSGVYLDAAFTHPLGAFARQAAIAYADARSRDPQAVGPGRNARRAAVERFARLINAAPEDVAVVPSTLEGENLLAAALGIGPGAGVVTDALHYDGSLLLYGELARRGAPVGVARPQGGRIDLAQMRALIGPKTRLVAVSLVSSATGFQHDLPELCAIAHAQGALVYADIIQAAGAIPVDVKASGVDFAGCGTYKWLMGDFGAAFLYVRPDRLDRLKRTQVGWRQALRQDSHALPFEPPGPVIDDFALRGGAAGLFEVSTPAWGALAVAAASLDHILSVSPRALAARRRPLMDQLRAGLDGGGFTPLTPPGGDAPILAYAVRDAEARFGAALAARSVRISLYPHRLRISPSIYNTPADIETLLWVLRG